MTQPNRVMVCRLDVKNIKYPYIDHKLLEGESEHLRLGSKKTESSLILPESHSLWLCQCVVRRRRVRSRLSVLYGNPATEVPPLVRLMPTYF